MKDLRLNAADITGHQPEDLNSAMQFSLYFFSSNAAESAKPGYDLVVECARFADQHGFTAVWTPERHFHSFGGIFPNPSLMGVLLSSVTSRVRIRAGSVVLPLHHPIRVAEEWSVVDNLSNGRVDVSFAVGWNSRDFVLAPQNYASRVDLTLDGIETVKRLWRGEEFVGTDGAGKETSLRVHPTPVQRDLPVWLTCTGKGERFRQAGQRNLNALTALIFQNVDELAQRISEYRNARTSGGHAPRTGTVTLMLHTLVGDTDEDAWNEVRDPLRRYLRSSVDLWKNDNKSLEKLTSREDSLEFAVRRYFTNSGLFGDLETCAQRIAHLREIGVDEIACLIDYGVEKTALFSSLERLCELRERFQSSENIPNR